MTTQTLLRPEESATSAAFHEANCVVRDAVKSAGAVISKECLKATIAALAPFQQDNSETAEVTRDLAYGPDPRHKFDWFRPVAHRAQSAPKVVLFVHGGGFVGGDKREPDSPLYDNIGIWAAANGLHAATITYRLAPQHAWPAGGEDVRRAVEAVAAHAKKTLGTAPRIYVMGHSAGAVHVAAAVTMQAIPSEVAGCMLISGFYDNTVGTPNPAYFGERPEMYEAQSSLQSLSRSAFPMFLAVAELDPIRMHAQAVAVMKGRVDHGGATPQFVVLDANNHFSPVLLLNSRVDSFGPRLLEFMSRTD